MALTAPRRLTAQEAADLLDTWQDERVRVTWRSSGDNDDSHSGGLRLPRGRVVGLLMQDRHTYLTEGHGWLVTTSRDDPGWCPADFDNGGSCNFTIHPDDEVTFVDYPSHPQVMIVCNVNASYTHVEITMWPEGSIN